MKIFPGMHYTMGGLWVDYKQATNVPGLYAAGECEYQYHGANRLGANALLSCIFAGKVSGPAAVRYARGLAAGADGLPDAPYTDARKRWEDRFAALRRMQGPENP